MGKVRRLGVAFLLAAAVTLGVSPTLAPVQGAVTLKLPDLAVLAPFDFRITVHENGTKRLRFSTVVVNIGDGPFRLYGYDEDGEAVVGDDLLVRQLVKRSDDTWLTRNTAATMFWAGDGHNHFHVKDLQLIKIERLDGTVLAKSAKLGFCFLDSYRYGSTAASVFNSANFVCQPNERDRVPMGVSKGWGDIYKSTIALQWIDITGLPDGDYKVKVVADPPYKDPGQFLESNETNNRGWATIRIAGTTVTVLSKSKKP